MIAIEDDARDDAEDNDNDPTERIAVLSTRTVGEGDDGRITNSEEDAEFELTDYRYR